MKGLDPITRTAPSYGFYYHVGEYGAVGDGVVDDAASIQAAIDAAKTVGNGTVYFPKGTYNVGTPLSLLQVKGLNFLGDGTDNTRIVSTGAFPAVQCNGIWRSKFEGIYFQAGAANAGKAVFELDGNYDGTHTQGVQGNNFTDCYFDASNLAGYAFAICRQGAGSGQGSENIFINTGFISGTTLVLIRGGNALNNLFLGGNLQDFITGFLLENGTMSLYRTAFQSTRGYAQIASGGADIDTSYGSVGAHIIDDACDSESLVHFKGGTGAPAIIRGLSQRSGTVTVWAASSGYSLNSILIKDSVTLGSKLYRVTTAGTSGGTEPTWPDTGTVSDGSVVWTETEYDNIIGLGTLDRKTCRFFVPGTVRMSDPTDQTVVSISANYSVPNKGDYLILADTTAGSITITLPVFNPNPYRIIAGQKITVKKTDTSANTVTIVQNDGGNPDAVATVIPGGSRGYVQLGYGPAVGGSETWWIVDKSFGVGAGSLNATVTSNFFKGGDVASAATITATGNLFHVTGTTTITSVSGTGVTAGTEITIIFDGALTFTDGSNLKLAGNFVTTADSTITLKYDGTNWFEVCRSVN